MGARVFLAGATGAIGKRLKALLCGAARLSLARRVPPRAPIRCGAGASSPRREPHSGAEEQKRSNQKPYARAEKIQSPPWPACENLVHASRDLSKFWFRVCPASQQRFVGTEEIPEQVRNKIVNAIMSLFLRDDSLLLIRCESWVEEVAAIFVRGSVSRQENCNHTHHK